MKSATTAITQLAKTKSISALKLSPRLFSSARSFMVMPMPTSMATLMGKLGSPSRRSRVPAGRESSQWLGNCSCPACSFLAPFGPERGAKNGCPTFLGVQHNACLDTPQSEGQYPKAASISR